MHGTNATLYLPVRLQDGRLIGREGNALQDSVFRCGAYVPVRRALTSGEEEQRAWEAVFEEGVEGVEENPWVHVQV
jgi:hypothetical protein